MGLAQVLLPPPLVKAYRFARWMVSDPKPILESSSFDGEDRWSGADDLWPSEESGLLLPEQPDLIVTQQWGLRCPGGEVHWNSWQGIGFDNPLDRVRMIATLQQTALDMGFAENQIGDFLTYYGWVTRNQMATVVYEDTGAYSLTDPAVSALGTPDNGESSDEHSQSASSESRDDTDAAPAYPSGDLCCRPVGGDAE